MDNKTDQPLGVLPGRELSSIEFVRDYIQFRFDGPCLNAITDPYLVISNKIYMRSTPGFCDTILGFIGLPVEAAEVIADEEIRIGFLGKKNLIISLKPEDYVTAEAAIFYDGSGKVWAIW